jgi:O-antigen/teichoic acid export membrane protein
LPDAGTDTASVPRTRAANASPPGSIHGFSGRVVTMFTSRVLVAGIAIVNSFLLARLIGPAGKGDFYLIGMLPTMLMVLIQLGLPQAFAYHAARGETAGLLRKTSVLAMGLALAAMAATVILLPALLDSLMRGLDVELIVLALLVLPISLHTTFLTGIVIGRGDVRSFATVNVIANVAVTVGFVVLVGILGLGVLGAILTTLTSAVILYVGQARNARRLVRGLRHGAFLPPTYGRIARFSLPSYPGSLTTFFSQRIDVLLIAWLLADASVPLGIYSLAVSLVEIVFFLPDAVAALFFPHVAGATRQDSDRHLPVVSRVTLLVTALAAIAVIPAAAVVLMLLLPAFREAWVPFLLLLPGVVALSVGKVLSGYLTGLGRTGVTSAIHVGAFLLNVGVNLALIPAFGIAGAALASAISYLATTVAFTVVAAGTSGASIAEMWLPTPADLRTVAVTGSGLGRRLLGRMP